MSALDWGSLAAFAAAAFVLFVTPGPGIALVVARTLREGFGHGALVGLGIGMGDLILYALVAGGLIAVGEAAAPALSLVRWVGAAYLFVLGALSLRSAWRGDAVQAAQRPGSRSESASRGASFAMGVATPLTNPKAIAFYAALLPAFVDFETASGPQIAAMALVIATVLPLVMMGYAAGAGWAHDRFESGVAARALEAASGVTLIGLAGLLVLRSLTG